jgi:hypothetical protein
LQAQAVTQSGIVQETYDPARLDNIPLPAEALAVLKKLFKAAKPLYVTDVDRREPVSTSSNVIDVDDSLNYPGIY